MDSKKYIGMDVHQASISVAVRDGAGKLVMECIIETKAATVLEFIRGLRGNLWVALEEGTSAAWLYDLVSCPSHNVISSDPSDNHETESDRVLCYRRTARGVDQLGAVAYLAGWRCVPCEAYPGTGGRQKLQPNHDLVAELQSCRE